uniref:Uncharacterized protein n=1 Tax=Dulem virus 35 TaxID=3145753 RepID=A0AAU8B0K6_9CAUD
MAKGKPTRSQRELIKRHGYPVKKAVILSDSERKLRFFIQGEKGVITIRKDETPGAGTPRVSGQ